MVAVLDDHLLRVAHGLLLPGAVPDVLPARDLREHQQPQGVAGVEKCVRLWVVRGADRVQPEFLFQDAGVESLQGRRHRVADVGIALVAVEAYDLPLLPVQIESVRAETGETEAEADVDAVEGFSGRGVDQLRPHCVKLRIVRAPQFDSGDRHAQFEDRGPGLTLAGKPRGLSVPHLLPDAESAAVRVFDLQPGHEDGRLQIAFCAQECVGDPRPLRHFQQDLAVQAAVSHVVDHVAEGRDIQALAAVEPYGEQVFFPIAQPVRQIGRERGIPAGMRQDLLPVHIHGRFVGGAAKRDRNALPFPFLRRVESAPVAADHLIAALVEVIERRFLYRVRQAHRPHIVFVIGGFCHGVLEPLREQPPVVPIVSFSHRGLLVLPINRIPRGQVFMVWYK